MSRFSLGILAVPVVLVSALVGGCPTSGGGGAVAPVDADDHVLGDAAATVTVIEYGDFQCPICVRFARETYPTIKANYIDTGRVRWVYRQFPLTVVHPLAQGAAEASECADLQGKFWEYHDALFESWPALERADLIEAATTLGLDVDAFTSCIDGSASQSAVSEDVATGTDAGVTGTPTFYINGEKFGGFRDAAAFAALLDAALAK